MALQDVGLRARLEGASAYVREAQGMESANTKLGRSLTTVSSQAGNTAGSIGKLLPVLAQVGTAAGLAFGSIGAARLGKQMMELAVNAEETNNLFKVSMGEMGDTAEQWVKDISTQLHLYKTEVKGFLGTLQAMITSMGIAPEQAYQMSTRLTALAYDMSSFYNIDFQTAFDKLQSGISGEVEPLKRLGIIVNQATAEQAALRHGVIKTGESMTDQQAVMGRYLAILDATTKAQGDLARTSESQANQWRALENNAKSLGEELGKSLIPMLRDATGLLNSLAENAKVSISAPTTELDKTSARIKELKDVIAYLEKTPISERMAKMSTVGGWGVTAESMENDTKEALTRYKAELAELEGRFANLEGARDSIAKVGSAVSELSDVLALAARNLGGLNLQFLASDQQTAKAISDFALWRQVLGECNGGAIDLARHMLDVQQRTGNAVTAIDTMSARPIDVVAAAAENARAAILRMGEAAARTLSVSASAIDKLGNFDFSSARGIFDSMAKAKTALDAQAEYERLLGIINAPTAVYAGGLDRAASATQDVASGASAATSAMQGLESAISECESAMRRLASVRLPGMQAYEDQMFELEMQIKRARLGELGMGESVSQAAADLGQAFDLLTAQQREIEQGIPIAFQRYEAEYQAALRGIGQAAASAPSGGEGQRESDRLAQELEKLQLMYDLLYQPQQRLLRESMEDILGENIEVPLAAALDMLREQGRAYASLGQQIEDQGGSLESESLFAGTIFDTRTSQIGIEGSLLDTYKQQTIELGKQVALYAAMNPGAAVTAALPGLADGGDIVRTGMVKVGERGPEILTLAAGTRVLPAGAANNVNSTRTYQDTYYISEASQPWRVLDAIRKESALRKLTAGRV